MADGYISSFDTKYHLPLLAAVTAIRLAAIDDNPAAIADPTWTPLVRTPPIRTTTPDTLSRAEPRRRC